MMTVERKPSNTLKVVSSHSHTRRKNLSLETKSPNIDLQEFQHKPTSTSTIRDMLGQEIEQDDVVVRVVQEELTLNRAHIRNGRLYLNDCNWPIRNPEKLLKLQVIE